MDSRWTSNHINKNGYLSSNTNKVNIVVAISQTCFKYITYEYKYKYSWSKYEYSALEYEYKYKYPWLEYEYDYKYFLRVLEYSGLSLKRK